MKKEAKLKEKEIVYSLIKSKKDVERVILENKNLEIKKARKIKNKNKKQLVK